jgi:hypothetical protein
MINYKLFYNYLFNFIFIIYSNNNNKYNIENIIIYLKKNFYIKLLLLLNVIYSKYIYN